MVDFWLGTFRLGELPADPVFSSLFPRGTDTVAIELLRDGDHYGVLFSSVDDAVLPSYLTCKIGFSNASKACNIWHDRGFPLVDAEIAVDTAKRVVQVTTSFWRFGAYGGFGLTLIPLLVGVAFLFYDGKSTVGWLLTIVGAAIILAGVLMNLDIYFKPTSLYNTLMMLGLFFGGLGVIARSLR